MKLNEREIMKLRDMLDDLVIMSKYVLYKDKKKHKEDIKELKKLIKIIDTKDIEDVIDEICE